MPTVKLDVVVVRQRRL